MSEEIVPYRTKNAAAEFVALSAQILELIEKAKGQGIEPTEVWLGRRELEIVDAGNTTTDANCYASKERTLDGLVVRRSFEDGVRVGVTLPNTQPPATLTHDGSGVAAAAICSRLPYPLRNAEELAGCLIMHGLLDEDAWHDPEGWDGGADRERVFKMLDSIRAEFISANAKITNP